MPEKTARPVSGSLVLSAGGASLTIPSGTTLIFTYDADDPPALHQGQLHGR